ncbi:MAG: DNA-3-methyladenine glycosylase [Flavobacteriales bacterium]|nr:DNA-3-methyladenine glycosylase [Flavobacteriales bacterium]MDW8432015.1 DNA-3-methyladenine glycosylase [Flavobacteriales bacterium]
MPEYSALRDRAFFEQSDVVALARNMVGLVLARKLGNRTLRVLITETEAYRGYDDKASHAANGKRTPRTEVFFRSGGHAYVYLCYGIHWLFNIITNKEGHPDAVLIRGGLLLEENFKPLIGPARLTRALEISGHHNALDLVTSQEIWLEKSRPLPLKIISTPRIGVGYAGEHALRPWRFLADLKETRRTLLDRIGFDNKGL